MIILSSVISGLLLGASVVAAPVVSPHPLPTPRAAAVSGPRATEGPARVEQQRPPRPPRPPQPPDDRRRGRDRDQDVEEERISRTFKVGTEPALLLHNVAGDITVTADGGSEIRIEALKHGRGSSPDDARAQLSTVDVSMQEQGGRVEVRTWHGGKNSRGWVDFNVIVPYGTRAELQSVSGDITISGLKGEVRAESVSGDVKGASLSRVATLKAVSGSVEIVGGESDGAVTLSAVNGDVVVGTMKARSLEVSSVSGDVTIRDAVCERAMVNSVSGDIEYTGRLANSGRYELKTHSGDIRLLHLGSAFDLAANTFSGDIRLDPAFTTLKMSTPGYGPGRSVRGAVGGGGASIELTTFSGDIQVTKGQ